MTRDEAIDLLDNLLGVVEDNHESDYDMALRMAIDALKQPDFKRLLEERPSVPPEQPEIIRCKDCTNWDTTWTNDWTPNYHYCPIIDGVRRDYFYCADAERRTDGSDR